MAEPPERSRPDLLADPRVGLAAERTLLAWIRTGLALMGFGFIVARFGLFLQEMAAVEKLTLRRGAGLSFWLGAGLLVVGVSVQAMAGVHHVRLMRRLARGPYRVGVSSMGIALTILLVVLGASMTIYLITWNP